MKTIYELYPDCSVENLNHIKISDTSKKGTLLYQDFRSYQINHLYVINELMDLEQHVDIADKPIYFLSSKLSERPQTIEGAETLVNDGKAFSVLCTDIYRAYYNLHDDEYAYFRYGYSRRTRNYLTAVMSRIGLISYSSASNSSGGENGDFTKGLTDTYTLPGYINTGNIEVGKLGDQWIAQFAHWYIIDDYAITKFIFNHSPSKEDVCTSQVILEIEQFFRENVGMENFICRSCGHKKNWLDTSGDLREKFENLKEKYCGC